MAFHVILLFLSSLLPITTATVYNVSLNSSDTRSGETLEHYCNISKYFASHSQLRFRPGQYFLNHDLVVQHLTNFSFIGGSCNIRCTLHASIILFNITNITIENINFENCNKNHSSDLHTTFEYNHVSISKPSRNASILLYNCTSVVINNISVLVNAGTTGILVVNVRSYSTLTNVSITVNYTICPTQYEHPEQINGILLYYDHYDNKTTNMQLDNFQFTANGSCAHPLQYAITLLLFQNSTNVSFIISNMDFMNLINVSLLYYYGETCGVFASNKVTLNCVISNNTGYSSFKIFEMILYNQGCFNNALLKEYCNQQYNNISFRNCKFIDNHNITSMIHMKPASSRAITGFIYVINSSFCNNSNSHFLTLEIDTDNVWQVSNYVLFMSANISSNSHYEGHNLISATNSLVAFKGTTFITNNSLYKIIMKLHLSTGVFQHNISITNNIARQIFYGTYIIIRENTILNVSFNTVYMVVRHTLTMGVSTRQICRIQFYSKKGNLDALNITELPFKVIAINNTHMTSKELLGNTFLYINCAWLAGTAFNTRNCTEVYKQVFNVNNLVIGNVTKRPVPLSVCMCNYENSSSVAKSVDCYSPLLGNIFPGETLTVQLSLRKQRISHRYSSRAIIVENSDQDDCSIVHASELSQTHFNSINYNCNSYRYTLWPKNETIKECKLFIGLSNMPEMFYVQVKPCPKGFTFQTSKKACYCDPLLSNKILSTSCNLKYETILRPANSWIYADTDDNTNVHTYKVAQDCPLDHCLPKSTHLNLSNPDSQCHFNRTGVLCGKCKPGFSDILGTPQCENCSNIYLLLLIPVGLTGIVLVLLFYIFNLTVWSGTINTLIFYINIVNINILTLFPGCQSITCIIFSQLNLDFRTKTCFYDGMDSYAKEWMNLLHPFYYISIAVLFILLSRYSVTVQKFTAQRALPVLATLILLSYTKIMLNVCNILFRFSTITHLPSNKIELVWSISATTPLFSVKFTALYTVCIVLFLLLLPFNIILLFARRLSCIKLVTKLKPLLDTYFSVYKDKAYYWTGLLLIIRVIVYILSTINKDTSFITTSILFAGLLCLHGTIQPFKSKFHNIQESLTIANLLAVHVATFYKKKILGLEAPEAILILGLVYIIPAVIIHCCMHAQMEEHNTQRYQMVIS